MGLFNRKKAPKNEPAPADGTKAQASAEEKKNNTPVKAEDIWNTPKKRKKKEPTEPESIGPETVKQKMEDMERELEEQKNKPKPKYEPIQEVGEGEVETAQEKYEEQYQIEHEKYVATHQQDIDEADIHSDLDRAIYDMVKERDRRAEESKKILGDIKQTDDEQLAAGMNALGVAKDETKDAEYQNINEVGSDEIAQKLSELGHAKDETLDKDYKNIKEIDGNDLDAKKKEFLEKYGDRTRPEDPAAVNVSE